MNTSDSEPTRLIEYALEPTHRRRVQLPPYPRKRVTRRFRRRQRASAGLPTRAGTIGLVILVLVLLAGVFTAGQF